MILLKIQSLQKYHFIITQHSYLKPISIQVFWEIFSCAKGFKTKITETMNFQYTFFFFFILYSLFTLFTFDRFATGSIGPVCIVQN